MPHDRFREFIDAHSDFLILSHIDPDGDAIGSCLALGGALRGIGKETMVVNESPLPESLRFLPGSERVLLPAAATRLRFPIDPDRAAWRPFSAAFVLDCSSLDRTGSAAASLVAPGAAIANIDHHAANDGFGDPKLVNVEASSTTELVAEILEACAVPYGPEEAQCLYVGLASDTGAFRYPNTTPHALRLAARLIEHGARPATAADELYGRKSERSLRILGLALTSLESRAKGQVGAITISRQMFEEAHATPEDAEGIVQFAKSLIGTRVGILIQETAPGEVRLSFRSDGSVDVNEVAGRFGGGGHKNAAGAKIRGDLAQVRGAVLDALDQAVNGGLPPPRR